ncbi:MFS transporter [Celerinatantimonas yamalensis]|uniref:MFS transporter n=1 Tax=Celerinatantimonas yamalensis TaxID=559956 RepID=A0ABW9G665_9GAMM
MVVTLLPLVSLFVSLFITMMGFGLIGLVLPVRMGWENIDTGTIGLILAMYAVGMLVGGIYSRKLIARVGHIRMFAACASLGAISVLGFSLSTNQVLWGLMRMAMGFCSACTFAVIDGWLSDEASDNNRGKILAISQITVMSAMFVSQFMINLAPIDQPTLFVIGGMLFCAGLIPLVMSRRKGPEVHETTSMSLLTLFTKSPLGVVSCFASGLLYSSLMNMLPLFAAHNKISGFMLSLFMAAAIMGSFVLQFPVGMLSDRFDRRAVLFNLIIFNMIASALIPIAAYFHLQVPMMIATGLTNGIFTCMYPMSISETFDRIQKVDMAAAMGGLLIVYAMGSTAGPLTASYMMAVFGDNALFVFLIVSQLALLGFVVYRMRAREALPVGVQESFVMHTEAGSALFDLDPRIPQEGSDTPDNIETQVAATIAENSPAAAVRMAIEIAQTSPEKAAELCARLAQIDDIEIGRLFKAIVEAAPDLSQDIAEALASNVPEQSADLVAWMSDNYPDKLQDIVLAIANQYPTDDSDSPNNDESNDDSIAEETAELRPADLEAYQESATELVSHYLANHPHEAVNIAAAVVANVPEAASDIVEMLHEADQIDSDALKSDIEEHHAAEQAASDALTKNQGNESTPVDKH